MCFSGAAAMPAIVCMEPMSMPPMVGIEPMPGAFHIVSYHIISYDIA